MRIIYTISLLLLLVGSISGIEKKLQNYIEFFAGLYALNSSGIPQHEKAQYFGTLEKQTGISAAMALAFVGEYRKNPQQWQKIQDAIEQQLKRATIGDSTQLRK